MPNGHPPLCLEFEEAFACDQAATRIVRDLRVIVENADTDPVGRLAKETLKLATMLRKRANERWRTVSTKYAVQPSLLEDGIPVAIEEGNRAAAECAEELRRLETQNPDT